MMKKIRIIVALLLVLCSIVMISVPTGEMTSSDWSTVVTITGRGDKTSQLFSISASTWRISWSYTTSTPDYSLFSFRAYRRGTTVGSVTHLSADGPSQSDVTYIYEGNDDFYIEALAANLDTWTITVEQQGTIPDQPEFIWDTIGTVTGQGDKTSALFPINTSFWRYQWEFTTSTPTYSLFSVRVYPEGQTVGSVNHMSTDGASASDVEYVYTGDDSFYFDVLSANLNGWSLTIQQPREPVPTWLTCHLSANTIELDDAVTISGTFTPAMSVEIFLAYKITEWTGIAFVDTDSSGQYAYSWTPEFSDEFEVVAYFSGDTTYDSSISDIQSLSVTKRGTQITCTTSSTNHSIDAPIILEGVLTPTQTASITLEYTTDTIWHTLATSTTQSDGSYQYTWTPSSGGSYQIRASYAGDDAHSYCFSASLDLEISKLTSTLSCTSTSAEIDEGKSITITGTLSPTAASETITLTYQPPSGSAITRSITTNADGEYSDTFTPSTTGSWRVTATWNGDVTYDDASSPVMTFNVKKSGCLIATATFGSELTPQVQFLRSFRDHRILSTFAGRQFMAAFNGFYYSWSPFVADTIRANAGISTPMQGLLSPLIGILQVSERVFTFVSVNAELAVITAGSLASTLLTIIYLVPITLVISYIRKYRPSQKLLAAMSLVWLASLAAIGIAEVTQYGSLMMVATGTFVLSTMGGTLLMALRYSPQLIARIASTTRNWQRILQ